jgi:predicted AAA+ superfamily ATPase
MKFESDNTFFQSQETLIRKIQLECGNKEGFIFIDEIQRKENSGLFLKGIYDKDLPYKFIVSGSGSLELKEKIHESLNTCGMQKRHLFYIIWLLFSGIKPKRLLNLKFIIFLILV